jgi:RNA polymerase sigma-70 factor (ECF subfamily)
MTEQAALAGERELTGGGDAAPEPRGRVWPDEAAGEDRRLVGQALAGSTRAFRELVERYRRRVVRLCYSFCGNMEDAEDIAQDVFVTVYDRLDGFRGSGKFSSWLFRIAVNRTLDHGRRAARRPKKQQLTDPMEARLQAPAARLQERESDERALACAVETIVDGLAAKYRMPLVLYYRQKMGYAEIAERLQMPVGTVKTLLHRGRMAVVKKFRAGEAETVTAGGEST